MEQARKKDVIRETDADAIRLARTLVRGARFGALAVLDPNDGSPQASRVAVATDLDGAPLILVSGLSGHTAAAPNRRAPSAAISTGIRRRSSMSAFPTSPSSASTG